jgi:hypothetical protein
MDASDITRRRQARAYYVGKKNSLGATQPNCVVAPCCGTVDCKLNFPSYELREQFYEGQVACCPVPGPIAPPDIPYETNFLYLMNLDNWFFRVYNKNTNKWSNLIDTGISSVYDFQLNYHGPYEYGAFVLQFDGHSGTNNAFQIISHNGTILQTFTFETDDFIYGYGLKYFFLTYYNGSNYTVLLHEYLTNTVKTLTFDNTITSSVENNPPVINDVGAVFTLQQAAAPGYHTYLWIFAGLPYEIYSSYYPPVLMNPAPSYGPPIENYGLTTYYLASSVNNQTYLDTVWAVLPNGYVTNYVFPNSYESLIGPTFYPFGILDGVNPAKLTLGVYNTDSERNDVYIFPLGSNITPIVQLNIITSYSGYVAYQFNNYIVDGRFKTAENSHFANLYWSSSSNSYNYKKTGVLYYLIDGDTQIRSITYNGSNYPAYVFDVAINTDGITVIETDSNGSNYYRVINYENRVTGGVETQLSNNYAQINVYNDFQSLALNNYIYWEFSNIGSAYYYLLNTKTPSTSYDFGYTENGLLFTYAFTSGNTFYITDDFGVLSYSYGGTVYETQNSNTYVPTRNTDPATNLCFGISTTNTVFTVTSNNFSTFTYAASPYDFTNTSNVAVILDHLSIFAPSSNSNDNSSIFIVDSSGASYVHYDSHTISNYWIWNTQSTIGYAYHYDSDFTWHYVTFDTLKKQFYTFNDIVPLSNSNSFTMMTNYFYTY